MKKIILLSVLLSSGLVEAQFKIKIEDDSIHRENNEVVVYTLNGSKDILTSQGQKKNNHWLIDIPIFYKGILKAYFPYTGQTVTFISENKDIELRLKREQNKIVQIDYVDRENKNWNEVIQSYTKKENVLPLLSQIRYFYQENDDFAIALKKEISRLQAIQHIMQENSFLEFYVNNVKYSSPVYEELLSSNDYKQFLIGANEMLESSSLMKPVLINFLKKQTRENLVHEIDGLLEELDITTSRGQTVLSELLSIFSTYGLDAEKNRYYKMASALTCSINQNLAHNIEGIKNTEIGAVFKDHIFTSSVRNTKMKKLSEIKADKKVVLFWSSACSHCLSELPIILENYNNLRKKNIEVVAFSLDQDKISYEEKIRGLPWINDSELKGWRSSYSEKYNVNATPTYYVLDANNKITSKPLNFSEFLLSINEK